MLAAGVMQGRLTGGMKINYCQTDNEPQAALIRMVTARNQEMEGHGLTNCLMQC